VDISSLSGVASAYSYANQIRNKSVSSSDFASSLNKATSSDNVVEAYKNSLQSKFGCPITVTSVGYPQSYEAYPHQLNPDNHLRVYP
jgi:hypothetical protein